jgi:hypothetical protein
MKIAILEGRLSRPAAAALALFAVSCALNCRPTLGAVSDPPATAAPPRTTPGEQKSDEKPPREKPAVPKPQNRSFAGGLYSIAGADREAVFIDLDTGRWMTPPSDLLVAENKGKPIGEWVFPKPLQEWIQRSGIDLAVQTDGRSLTVLGFDLPVGDSFPADDHKSEGSIAGSAAPASADRSQWITLKQNLVRNTLRRRTRFVTREGGSGTFGFRVSGAYGPNTIHVDCQLSHRLDVAKPTVQPAFNVYQSPLLEFPASDLVVDVDENKLRLRIAGGSTQIELVADQVVVREDSQPKLRAARLHAGRFEIDAGAGEVLVLARQKATLRRVNNRVEIAIDKPRVRGRWERNPDKRVAQTDRLILSMSDLKISQEDSLEWTTVKPSPELFKKQAEERRKRFAAGEALYVELAAKHGYRLAPGQYIKRIPPPFPEPRDAYWRVTRPDQFYYLSVEAGRGPGALSYLWDGKVLHEGSTGGDHFTLAAICDVLHGLKRQEISGPRSLLVTPLPGDWVYREGMTADILVAQLEPILRQELKLPIHLEFGEKEQEVYVARGTWHMTPLSDTRVRSGGVQIYGKELNFGPIRGGGGHGGLTEFLDAVGEWIDARVIRDNVANPPQRLTWQYHLAPHTFGQPTSDAELRADRDPALVLHNVEVQTALKFTKETRPVRMLFVEEKPLSK